MNKDKWEELLELLRQQQNLLMRVDTAQTRKEILAAYEAFSQHLAKIDQLINQISFDELEEAEQEAALASLRNLRLEPIYVNV
jgi:hypothetical protein